MRIAMITNNYKPFVGGVPISIERLADSLRARGHKVFIFAPEYGDNRVEDDIYTCRFRTVTPFLRGGFRPSQLFDSRVGRVFPTMGVDLIHVHSPFVVGPMALRLGRQYRLPVVFTHHTRYEQYLHYVRPYALAEARARDGHPVTAGFLRELREDWLPAWVAAFENRCSAVAAPSESLRQTLLRQGVRVPVHVLPTGLPESAFARNDIESAKLRQRYVGGRPYLLCTVSRLGREKNLDALLRGMAALREQIGDTFRLLVLGEGPERAALEALSGRLGLSETVAFCGAVENSRLPAFHRASDLFVFTSRSETQGIVLLEAMAAGRPIVALDAPGTRDVIRSGVNGALTREADFAPCIASLLENPARRREMSAAAEAVAERFTTGEIARRAEALYAAAADEHPAQLPMPMPAI